MKKTIFVMVGVFLALPLFSQEIVYRDSILQDPSENLLKSKVITLNLASPQEIKQSVKNWAGQKFVNMNEVLVSETENQLVFRYIENYNMTYNKMIVPGGEYTRIVIQIKYEKIKISFYDGGNKDNPSIKITDCFKIQNVDHIKNEGRAKPTYSILLSYMDGYKSTFSSLENFLVKDNKVVLEDF